jgi:hypothetical protein
MMRNITVIVVKIKNWEYVVKQVDNVSRLKTVKSIFPHAETQIRSAGFLVQFLRRNALLKHYLRQHNLYVMAYMMVYTYRSKLYIDWIIKL